MVADGVQVLSVGEDECVVVDDGDVVQTYPEKGMFLGRLSEPEELGCQLLNEQEQVLGGESVVLNVFGERTKVGCNDFDMLVVELDGCGDVVDDEVGKDGRCVFVLCVRSNRDGVCCVHAVFLGCSFVSFLSFLSLFLFIC